MSSFSELPRRLFLLTSLTSFAACGFEPVLQNGSRALQNKVRLPDAADQISYWLRRELEKQFGEPISPEFALSFEYTSETDSLATTENNLLTRARLKASGKFIGINLVTGEMLLNESFTRVASYSSNSDRYASDRARITTEERLVISLAQDFANRFRRAALAQ